MYDRIGEKIKVLARVIGIGGSILFFTLFIYFLSKYIKIEDSSNDLGLIAGSGYLSLSLGSLVLGALSIISSWPLYGFGELICRVSSIDEKVKKNAFMEDEIDDNHEQAQKNEANNEINNEGEDQKAGDGVTDINADNCANVTELKCPICGIVLTNEMIDSNLCWECGNILDKNLCDDKIDSNLE